MLSKEKYTQRLTKIEAVINAWLPEKPDSAWLERVFGISAMGSDPSGLVAPLARPGWDMLNRGGKRWRPMLMVLVAEAIAGESGLASTLPLTPLVEFPHTASLIHDDIEDNSDERRGKPTVHLIYGTDTAINSGSFLYFLSMACLEAWVVGPRHDAASLKAHIWKLWASHMRGLHFGQAMDIAWHRDYNSLPSLDEYDRMCRLKTGCLARLAAVLGSYSGAFTSGGNYMEFSEQDGSLKILADVFGAAAEQFGVGFQILDDVKNLETGVPGKKRGDDIVEGKKSLPVLLYLHKYPDKRDFVTRCFTAARSNGVGAPEVEEFIAALTEAGVLEEARGKALGYIQESRRVFSSHLVADFLIKEEGRELLVGLADMLG